MGYTWSGEKESCLNMWHTAYIGLGSNLGDREGMIASAVESLHADEGVRSFRLSTLHETEAVGGAPGQGRYLNAAGRLETTHEADALLELMQRIEQELGRERQERWGARTIDLDLLLFDDQVIGLPHLIVPHPRMHERRFVLAPLAEIAGHVMHPTQGKTINELLATLS